MRWPRVSATKPASRACQAPASARPRLARSGRYARYHSSRDLNPGNASINCHWIVSTASSGIKPTIDRTFNGEIATARRVQHVVVKFIFFVPETDPTATEIVHGGGDAEEMLEELRRDVFVNVIFTRELDRDAHQIQAKTFPSSWCHRFVQGGCHRGTTALRSNTPMLSSPRNPPSKIFLPSESFRFTHQVKARSSLWKIVSRNARSPLPVCLRLDL